MANDQTKYEDKNTIFFFVLNYLMMANNDHIESSESECYLDFIMAAFLFRTLAKIIIELAAKGRK